MIRIQYPFPPQRPVFLHGRPDGQSAPCPALWGCASELQAAIVAPLADKLGRRFHVGSTGPPSTLHGALRRPVSHARLTSLVTETYFLKEPSPSGTLNRGGFPFGRGQLAHTGGGALKRAKHRGNFSPGSNPSANRPINILCTQTSDQLVRRTHLPLRSAD